MSEPKVKCFQCNAELSDAERADGWCESCGKPLPERLKLTPGKRAFTDAAAVNPWMPMQMLAATFLFGPGAGGILAGINSTRMGHEGSGIGCVIVGILLFLVEAAVLVFVVPVSAAKMVGTAFNLAVGGALALQQKPQFDEWKNRYWRPADKSTRYRPSRIGQLFLIAIVVAAVEVGIIYVMVLVAPGE